MTNGGIVYDLFTNFENESKCISQTPKTMMQRFFRAPETINALHDNAINQINEFILNIIKN